MTLKMFGTHDHLDGGEKYNEFRNVLRVLVWMIILMGKKNTIQRRGERDLVDLIDDELNLENIKFMENIKFIK